MYTIHGYDRKDPSNTHMSAALPKEDALKIAKILTCSCSDWFWWVREIDSSSEVQYESEPIFVFPDVSNL